MKTIEENTSYSWNGSLYASKQEAVEAGLSEIIADLGNTRARLKLNLIHQQRETLIYLLTEHQSVVPPFPSADVVDHPEVEQPTTLSVDSDRFIGHAVACRYRVTGIRKHCACDLEENDL